jgi:hypothetical protein
MSNAFRLTMAAIILAALGALAWISHTINRQIADLRFVAEAFAQTAHPNSAAQADDGYPVTVIDKTIRQPRLIPVREPISLAAARTWIKLHQRITMPFGDETPLENVLKYVKDAARDEDGTTLEFYVDPNSLQEVERTMQSPVTLDLDGLPLERSLGLLLKQLGLQFSVDTDGLVVITSEMSEDGSLTREELMLKQLEQLSEQLTLLRQEVAALRSKRNGTAGSGSGRGSLGGSVQATVTKGGLQ